MTDQEKIEKLAKWEGWTELEYRLVSDNLKDGPKAWFGIDPKNGKRNCTPAYLKQISAAWMLMEKACALSLEVSTDSIMWDKMYNVMHGIEDINFFHMTTSEAARAISEAVLEVIDDEAN